MKNIFALLILILPLKILAQNKNTIFDYSDIPNGKTPTIGITNEKKLVVIYNDNAAFRIGFFDFKTKAKSTFDVVLNDSFKVKSRSSLNDSIYETYLTTKENTYKLKINIYNHSHFIEAFTESEYNVSGKICLSGSFNEFYYIATYFKKQSKISFYKYKNKNLSDIIDFTIDKQSSSFDTIKKMVYDFAECSLISINPFDALLTQLSESKKAFIENDKVYFLKDENLRKYEVLIFDLIKKTIVKKEIKLEEKFCLKEPNGKFYASSTISNNHLFVQMNCRHNSNLYVVDINTGAIVKHFVTENKIENTLTNTDYIFENFKKGIIEKSKLDEKYLLNVDVHPNFINVMNTGDYYIINQGTYHIPKILKVEDLLPLASLVATSTNFFRQDFLTHDGFIFGIRRMPEISSTKYLSYVLNKDFTLNVEKTNLLNDRKMSNQFYQTSNNEWTIINNREKFNFEYNSFTSEFKLNN